MNQISTLKKRFKVTDNSDKSYSLNYTSSVVTKRLYHFNELPDWQKDNELVLTGYVRETNSVLKCLYSLTYFHNESISIYTHLVPTLLYLLLLFLFTDFVLLPKFPYTHFKDYIMIHFYLLGSCICLGLSSCFHCLKQHSEMHSKIWSKADYIGIIILISFSMVSLLYYGFHDHSFYFRCFTILTLTLGFGCMFFVLNDKFSIPEYRIIRAFFFICFALSGFLPIMAGIWEFGIIETFHRIQLKYIILEALFYITGAIVYGVRIPESLAPGKFDFIGHSHQIFHILVVFGSICHFRAILGSYTFMHTGINYPDFLIWK